MVGIIQKKRERNKGVILILTLWIVMVLALLAQSLASEMQVEVKLTRMYRDLFLAEQLARMGVARAVADLRNDQLLQDANEEGPPRPYDALGDVWARSVFPRKYDVRDERDKIIGHYEVMVVDESGKLNLNLKDEESNKTMRYLLEALDVDEEDAIRIADAIWDWKDEDDETNGEIGESEREYYTELAREDSDDDTLEVYPRNGPFSSLDELLLIPGITPELFYGYDPEEEDGPEFFPVMGGTMDSDRKPALRDLLTLSTNLLNINTASLEVLSALCALSTEDIDDGRSLAEEIISYRQSNDEEDIDNDQAFLRLQDLLEVNDVTQQIMEKMAQGAPMTVGSTSFTIYSRARAGRSRSRARGSGIRKQRFMPTSQVVVLCQRGVVNYRVSEEDESPIDPSTLAGEGPPDKIESSGIGVWRVPVVYFRHWVSN